MGFDGEGIKVSVVDADEAAFHGKGTLEFLGVMDFDEDIKVELVCVTFKFMSKSVIKDGEDEENGISSDRFALVDLVVVKDKVFSHEGDRGNTFYFCEVLRMASEPITLAKYGEASSTIFLVIFSNV